MKSPTVQTSIIIPAFNQVELTLECLTALTSTIPIDGTVEIVVIDNGSEDSIRILVESFNSVFPIFNYKRFETNRGFVPACNEGAYLSRGQNLLFLNNDTIPQNGWFTALHATHSRPGVGLVGSKLLYPETRLVNHCGYAYNYEVGGFYPIYHNFPENAAPVNRERQYLAILGACILLSRSLFFEVGGFREYGLEDIDLCLRIRAAGKQVWYCPHSVVLHHGSATLKNSVTGSVPSMNSTTFNQIWPQDIFVDDDQKYYREDGLRAVIEDGAITISEVTTESYAIFEQAKKLLGTGELFESRKLLIQSLELYPHNTQALELLVSLLKTSQDLTGAIQSLEKFLEIEPWNSYLCIQLIEICYLAGETERAHRHAAQILAWQSISEADRLRIKLLTSSENNGATINDDSA